MQGNPVVIEQLNAALSSELTAIVQYMVQAEMCSNWGYARLGGELKKHAIEEMRHAESLIERLLFLDAVPAVKVGLQPKIGASVKAHFEEDLVDEKDAVRQYNSAAKICLDAGDNGSRELFERLLKDEEEHTDHLEAQLHAIEEMGIQNFLSQQLIAGK